MRKGDDCTAREAASSPTFIHGDGSRHCHTLLQPEELGGSKIEPYIPDLDTKIWSSKSHHYKQTKQEKQDNYSNALPHPSLAGYSGGEDSGEAHTPAVPRQLQ
jgi:hypothetical protein